MGEAVLITLRQCQKNVLLVLCRESIETTAQAISIVKVVHYCEWIVRDVGDKA